MLGERFTVKVEGQADSIDDLKAALSDLITLELGISKKDSLYECGRAYDVFSLASQVAILDDDGKLVKMVAA